jgi:hypothetical protein
MLRFCGIPTVPHNPKRKGKRMNKASFILAMLVAAAPLASIAPSAFAAEAPGETVDQAEVQARQVWRETMHDLSAPEAGCFHASFPSTQWEKVECDAPSARRSAVPNTVGNGYDVVAQAPKGHFFSSVKGSFPQMAGVKSETDGGVANEYTLQLNTDQHNTAACDGYSGCRAWQQYVISSDFYPIGADKSTGKTEVFIQDWLENYGVDEGGANICPKGYTDSGRDINGGDGDDCLENSPAAVVYKGKIPITKLTELELSGTAKHGGSDEVTATYGKDAYKVSVKDSRTDIASEWSQAEFNVFGNGGASGAEFNSGSALLVELALKYGSTATPTLQPPSKRLGTTGETNNLTLIEGEAKGGSNPFVEFIEEN